MRMTITKQADQVKPLAARMEDETPGVFGIMADFKSYEIQHWLDTTTPNVARALFETGQHLELDRAALLGALKEIEGLLDCGNIEQSHWDDCLGVARAAIKQAEAT